MKLHRILVATAVAAAGLLALPGAASASYPSGDVASIDAVSCSAVTATVTLDLSQPTTTGLDEFWAWLYIYDGSGRTYIQGQEVVGTGTVTFSGLDSDSDWTQFWPGGAEAGNAEKIVVRMFRGSSVDTDPGSGDSGGSHKVDYELECDRDRVIITPATPTTAAPTTTAAPATTVAATTVDNDSGAAAPTTAAPELPATGNGNSSTMMLATLMFGLGIAALAATRRRQLS